MSCTRRGASRAANRLRELHDALDHAVRDAYGFNDIDDKCAQLLALNHLLAERVAAGESDTLRVPGPARLAGAERTGYAIRPAKVAADLSVSV